MHQRNLFEKEERYAKLDEKDPLPKLHQSIDWSIFLPLLNQTIKTGKKKAGRPSYDVIVMFKTLVIQHLYNLSDDQTEFQIRDRATFSRFIGKEDSHHIPDAKTIWHFREKLISLNLVKGLFDRFNRELATCGYEARKGQIVDASFVDVPKQRNSRKDNKQIKEGVRPDSFDENPHVGSQKDTDARWAKKNQEAHFGYKDHIAIDNEKKLIRTYEVTSAQVHDSNVFEELLTDNTSRNVWADSAYQSKEKEEKLIKMGYLSKVHMKGNRGKALTTQQKKSNKTKSKIRARIEHVFGSITNEQGGLFSRVIGFKRNAFKIGMMNLVYNLRRFTFLQGKSSAQ